jgi:hypothetical protein
MTSTTVTSEFVIRILENGTITIPNESPSHEMVLSGTISKIPKLISNDSRQAKKPKKNSRYANSDEASSSSSSSVVSNTELSPINVIVPNGILANPIMFKDVKFVKLPNQMYIQKELADNLKFHTLVKFVKDLIKSGGMRVFGSFTHYFAYCMTSDPILDPWESTSSSKYNNDKSYHTPDDVDLLYSNFAISHGLITKHTSCIISNITYIDMEGTETKERPAHSYTATFKNHTIKRAIATKHDTIIGPVKIKLDIVSSSTLEYQSLDFDVNSLILTHEGLIASMPVSTKYDSTTVETVKRMNLTKVMNAIKDKKATFIGKFIPGPDHNVQREYLVKRFRKMIEKGFTIVGWNERYPRDTVDIYDVIEYSSDYTKDDEKPPLQCALHCGTKFHVGDVLYYTKCCNTRIGHQQSGRRIYLCDDCFWNDLNQHATKGRMYKCAFCSHKQFIFSDGKHEHPDKSDNLELDQNELESNNLVPDDHVDYSGGPVGGRFNDHNADDDFNDDTHWYGYNNSNGRGRGRGRGSGRGRGLSHNDVVRSYGDAVSYHGGSVSDDGQSHPIGASETSEDTMSSTSYLARVLINSMTDT